MKNFILLLCLICSTKFLAQEVTASFIEKEIHNFYKIPRESLFVHLNKTTFLKGEEVFFKGYVYDRNNQLPAISTKEVKVEVFDTTDVVRFEGTYPCNNGFFKGNIVVDSLYNSQKYFVRVSTNWMNNFVEDISFSHEFSVLDSKVSSKVLQKNRVANIQIFPEGGDLISGTKNTVGVKISDNNGMGILTKSGQLIDDAENIITNFETNKLGFAKLNTTFDANKKYYISIDLDGSEYKKELPIAKDIGLGLSVNNRLRHRIPIRFNYNKETAQYFSNKQCYFFLHKNKDIKKIKINFNENETDKLIYLDREDLYSGVNTITIFVDGTPIAERKIYNYKKDSSSEVKIDFFKEERDSLIFGVRLASNLKKTYNISVSVLPKETKVYNPAENIISSLSLKPYIKGPIENPKYYFTDIDEDKKEALDLLLITQGWTQYDWENLLDPNKEPLNDFRQGITLKGKLQGNNLKNIDKVLLLKSKYHESKIVDLTMDKSFVLTDFFADKNENLKFSALKSNGKFVKKGVYFQELVSSFNRPLSKDILPIAPLDYEVFTSVKIPQSFLANSEILDEVLIRGKEKEKEKNPFVLDHINRKAKVITEREANYYPTILDYIQNNGFRVKYGALSKNSTNFNDITLVPVNNTSDSFSPPAVYIDDMYVYDMSVLLDLSTEYVDRILIDPRGSTTNLRGSGTIMIYKKQNLDISTTGGLDFFVYKITNGFEKIKKFYTPTYNPGMKEFFINYAAIHWEPELKLEDGVPVPFKIHKNDVKNISFFIEGMADNGDLISIRKDFKM
ncbi:hypothetical protein ACJRPK_01960 [Aquimarina sp. 2-A2]|uniref:hypothetical protein n=1 Tax=Aquimarina sp. 2-A2 TaxID=3382644 RepID=UPI00387F03FA